MKPFRDFSIKSKLNLLVASAAASALLLACAAFVANDVGTYRESAVRQLSAVADVVGANTASALTFNDPVTAEEVLSSLHLEPMVRSAFVYDADGRPFAAFPESTPLTSAPPLTQDGHEFAADGSLNLFATISDEDEVLGHLYVHAGMDYLHSQMWRYAQLVIAVALISLSASMAMSSRLQHKISGPILLLAETLNRISREGDYRVRVNKPAEDEIGSLFDAFNRMLDRIEASERDLKEAHNQLERRVVERTLQLSEANEALVREVGERTRAEDKLRELQHHHIETARQAGMAEIATSVLHNVGNVLNSVNVSSGLIVEKLQRFGVADLTKAVELVEQHHDGLGEYITNDPRGKHLPRFLIQLCRHMATSEQELMKEAETLIKNIDHIKDIIAVQQSHAGLSGFIQDIRLEELFEDAIQINSASAARHGITFIRDFEDLPTILADRQKILQILINLVTNARHALAESNQSDKQLILRLKRLDEEHVTLEVQDNGVGIAAENLTRIFSHGFTTRASGHGFGLHSAALMAKEMHGELTAHSDGPGTGALFRLELPLSVADPMPAAS